MRHGRGTHRARRLDDRDGLLRPLGGDAQRVDLAPQHVALDEVAHEAIEHRSARIDFMVPQCADRLRLPANRGAVIGRGAAGVDENRLHRPAVVGEARDAVRGIEAAGEGQGDQGLGWLHNA